MKRGFYKTNGTGCHIESIASACRPHPMPFRSYGNSREISEKKESLLKCQCDSGLPIIARNPYIAAQGYCRKCKPERVSR